ncbi:tubby-related protein 4-like, partial [Homarus americanus]|uniref:tubby-related protein 4-like n=1 Tax=Homarus americanus TaxID=6706 RepID=UPI001C460087
VTLVKWNEPYQKLATCDSSGIIFVWIKYEGRWSIELINDRNTPVTHFSWSHDGRMALICYQDGFVLVGSVAGQRYWSSMLNLQSTITSGVFTPEDQQVYFGTTSGMVIVMDVHGAMVSQVPLLDDTAITDLAWSCPKFKMEENEENNTKNCDGSSLLAVVFQTGLVYLLRTHDDLTPIVIRTGLRGVQVEWTNSGEVLAVAGHLPDEGCTVGAATANPVRNVVKFYTRSGTLRYTHHLPLCQVSPRLDRCRYN